MKWILIALMLIPSVAFAGDCVVGKSNTICTEAITDNTEAIKSLAESGEICKVIGHKWSDGGYSLTISFNKYSRFCNVCGRIQNAKWVFEEQEGEIIQSDEKLIIDLRRKPVLIEEIDGWKTLE